MLPGANASAPARRRSEAADARRVETWRAGFFSPESLAAGFAAAAAAEAAAVGDVEAMMEEEREGLAPESFITMAKPDVMKRKWPLRAGATRIAVSGAVG